MASLLTGGANEQRRKALLDMLSDEVFQRGLLRGAANIVPGIARGISADLLGGPVDMATMALNVPMGLLGKKIEKPVGGSEWIGQKMEQAGLLSPQTGHPAETASRIAGGLLASPQVVGRVGSAVENVAQGMAQNAMTGRSPVGLNAQIGAVSSGHRPMKVESGAATLNNLEPAFGPDIYGKNAAQFFGTGDYGLDSQTLKILQSVRGKPEAMVSVYRAVSKNAPEASIKPGDWVTVNKNYAKTHGESALGGQYKIIETKVPARYLTTNADSFHEQGYYPD